MKTVDKKENLIENIAHHQGFKVFDEFSNELKYLWDEFYNNGGSYNLSYEWCKCWFEHFSKGKLCIITFWQNKELKLLAPFYNRNNRLYLIGSKPDMFDEFGILCDNKKIIDKFIDFILENNYELNFKHLSAESLFAKSLINKLAGAGVEKISEISETKPVLKGGFSTENITRSDIKRCRKNLLNEFNEEFEFEFSTEKTDEKIAEFIAFHKYRWGGGMLEKKKNLEKFVKNLVKNNKDLVLTRLYTSKSQKTAAYCVGYIDSQNKYWLSMTAYNYDYKKAAPGKVILFELIKELFEHKNINEFDFGRGSELYKRNFANDEQVLFNIATFKKAKMYMKLKRLIDKILRLVFRQR